MENNVIFDQRPDEQPMIYGYMDPRYPGKIKVGYASKGIDKRVAEQYPVLTPGDEKPYNIGLRESAMFDDGDSFMDHDVHRILEARGFQPEYNNGKKTEWYSCSYDDVKSAILTVREHTPYYGVRNKTFKPRPEQEKAINMTIKYYESYKKEFPNKPAKFLWNAKMRFGKTFASYELAKRMNFNRVLILTFKPAVQSAWKEDLENHKDFEGWQFISNAEIYWTGKKIDEQYEEADKSKPIVCFGSFQDLLGTNENGGIKAKNEWIHTTNWDLVIFDEYHYGAWRDNAKKLFENTDEDEDFNFDKYREEEAANAIKEVDLPITTSYYLYLSGTPFRALSSGEFIEEQIFSWTYSMEQQAKIEWPKKHPNEPNPYEALPRMVMMTYKIPDSMQRVAKKGEFDEFDLNEFFRAEGKGTNAQFVHKNEVQRWLNLINGDFTEIGLDSLKAGERPPMPFADGSLLKVLNHTVWYLNDVASCFAMYNLMMERNNTFYQDYKINVCAGTQAGIGVKALHPVLRSLGGKNNDPLHAKTITLTCGKLLTGVTVKPWTGIFMLTNLSSPESYFQAAFRVQSPWDMTNDEGNNVILKHDCYVFDFALNRALRQISDYARNLDTKETNPETKVAEFIKFLPVLAYDGMHMTRVDAADILDLAMSGTTATMLAKRWESALLVNVDNDTLKRLLDNPDALSALESIEGFRSLNSEIQTIINRSEAVKKAKTTDEKLTQKEKKELSEEEKEIKSKRKLIQEKLIKFATRIPVFMYLSDYREYSLKDVIQQLEPALFKKVTGLTVKDFNLLVSLNVFNEALMNDAVYKFKRYEDGSLVYTGINRHEGEKVGLFNTVLTAEDYELLAKQQQDSMKR